MVPDGAPPDAGFTMKAVFVEVVEPERIVFKEPDVDMTSTSTFTDLGDGRTRVVIHQTNMPAGVQHRRGAGRASSRASTGSRRTSQRKPLTR